MAAEINSAFKAMLDSGLRVYALAISLSKFSETIRKDITRSDMTFVALVGIGVA